MKRALLVLAVLSCLVFSGCGWMDGSFHYVAPHEVPQESENDGTVTVSSYAEMRSALEKMVLSGKESGIFYIRDMDVESIHADMDRARNYILTIFPMGAYAVEELSYEIGTNTGIFAAAVDITYLRSRSDIQRISTVRGMDEVLSQVDHALENMDAGVVVMVEYYQERDILQHIQAFASEHPELVMETPQLSIGTYPETGSRRIIELKFSYQNSRDLLKIMRSQVKPVFEAAKLYVSGESDALQKYTQLFSFLMERYRYEYSTSNTPTYSLLLHGVGDSKTFAQVYAAMCRSVDLDCSIVAGTRSGEPWYWNIIRVGENYCHLDLLLCSYQGGFTLLGDNFMDGYVWDYSRYPVCTGIWDSSLEATDNGEVPPSTEGAEESTTLPE